LSLVVALSNEHTRILTCPKNRAAENWKATSNPITIGPQYISGWWFGTGFIFHFIYGIILPIDFHIFQDG
jgi:hypothetical protein